MWLQDGLGTVPIDLSELKVKSAQEKEVLDVEEDKVLILTGLRQPYMEPGQIISYTKQTKQNKTRTTT